MRDVANAMCDIQALTPRQRRMVERYAGDLVSMLEQVERVLKPSGQATLVIGNSCLKTVFIQHSEVVAKAADLAGLTLAEPREDELPMGSRYLPMTAPGPLSPRIPPEPGMTFLLATSMVHKPQPP